MALRSLSERIVQTVLYEIGGLLLAAPLYSLIFGAGAAQSVLLMVVLSVLFLIWQPLHNSLFDRLEWRFARRVASDRPPALRIVHALSLEVTSIIVTLPAIMLIGGHGLWEAVALDLGLSALYAAYAFVFHLAYDRWRPVAGRPLRSEEIA
ncbi:MAG: PACE efflux transporter [Pseudomonadota bacterium]